TEGGAGSWDSTWSSVSAGVGPWKGGRPVRHSYRIAPSAYTSAAGPTFLGPPPACSGAMYEGVPNTAPVEVSAVVSPMFLARPKSGTLGMQAAGDAWGRAGPSPR